MRSITNYCFSKKLIFWCSTEIVNYNRVKYVLWFIHSVIVSDISRFTGIGLIGPQREGKNLKSYLSKYSIFYKKKNQMLSAIIEIMETTFFLFKEKASCSFMFLLVLCKRWSCVQVDQGLYFPRCKQKAIWVDSGIFRHNPTYSGIFKHIEDNQPYNKCKNVCTKKCLKIFTFKNVLG